MDPMKPLGVIQFDNADSLPIEETDKLCQFNSKSTKILYPHSSSSFPFDRSHITSLSSSQVKAVHPTSFGRMYGSPKRSRHDTVGHDFLSLSLTGFTEVHSQGSKKNKACSAPSSLGLNQYGCLHYEPPQIKDLMVRKHENLKKDNLTGEDNGQLFCSTPPSRELSVSANGSSPESMLRNSAMSYTKTPSIIRKKSNRLSEAVMHTNCTGTSTPRYSFPSAPDRRVETSSRKERISGCKTSVSGKSLGRRLEYAFDMEWDASRCRTPVSAAPPCGLSLGIIGANTMLTP